MAWDRADRWTVSGHLCGRELSCGEWEASSAVLKVTVMRMPERRLFRLIKSDTPLNTLVSKALSLYRYRYLELELEDDGLEKLQELYDVPFFHLSDRPIFYLAYRRIGLSAEYPYRSFTNIYLLTNCGP